jgi:VCBS repeat-containing protein
MSTYTAIQPYTGDLWSTSPWAVVWNPQTATASSTSLTLLGNDGTTTVLSGTAFLFDQAMKPLGGTVTRVERYDGTILLSTITDTTTSLENFQAYGDVAVGTALSGDDVINGSSLSDLLFGYSGNDTFNPGDSTSPLDGLWGDFMIGGAGNDIFNGGVNPLATVVYALEGGGAGVSVDLGTGIATDTFGDTDTLNNIRVVVGTFGNDYLAGGNSDETFYPGLGTDTINGGSGFDVLSFDSLNRFFVDREFLNLFPEFAWWDYGGVLGGIVVQFDSEGAGTVFGTGCGCAVDANKVYLEYGSAIFAGIEKVVGTSGYDTAAFSGLRADYTLTTENDQLIVEGPDGRQLLSGFERLQFADGMVTLPISGEPTNTFTIGDDGDFATITEALASGRVAPGGTLVLLSGYNTESATVGIENLTFSGDASNTGIVLTLSTGIMAITLTGTAPIAVTGNGNDNSITGNDGSNVLFGGAGNDSINGGAGDDTVIGGAGWDMYYVDSTGDRVTENPGEGWDTVYASLDYTLGSNIESLVLLDGAGSINGTGNDLDNVLVGNSGNNTLYGMDGDDSLNGEIVGYGIWYVAPGDDTLIGGAGNDRYFVDSTSDVVVEYPGQDNDTVYASVDYTLGPNIENLVLLDGAGSINGRGNDLDNVLVGNYDDNTLNGMGGDDVLHSNGGNDTLIGGAGNDTYYGYYSDAVTENPGEGFDTVYAYGDYTLGPNIESLVLENGRIGTGNKLDNLLFGNPEDNTLYGMDGDDVLHSNGGNDILIGGAGNDRYFVESTSAVVVENPGEGNDTVYALVDYTIGPNIETLVLLEGVGSINGTGNDLDNVLVGNSYNNVLDGKGGHDRLAGGGGNDTFVFAAGEADGDWVDNVTNIFAGALETFRFVGFGTAADGATFTQIGDTNQWQIHSGLDGHNEVITFLNGARVYASNYVFEDAPGNTAPVATIDSYSTNEDTVLTVNVAAGVLLNDTDADTDPLTAVLVSGAQHGTLALNADGSFSYTPTANYNGPDSFTYKANDGQADSNVVTATLAVNPVNDAPVASNDSYAMMEDTTLTASLLANDSDVDGDALTVSLVSGPAHGSITFNSDSSFTYTPLADYNGADSFTYKANDGQADSNVATVSLTVTLVNDAPVAINDSYAMTGHTVLTAGVLANDSDVDGDPLYAALVSGPAHGKLTFNSDGSFVYKPLGHYNGPDSFTYKAFDGSASSDVTTVSITVNPVNQTLAIHDFNADANSDILWQHDSGLPQIWAMAGTTPTDIAILPNPGSDWLLV